jgi:ankyrin repeat protein
MTYSNLVLKLIKTLPNFDCVDDDGNNICHHLAQCGDEKIFSELSKSHSPNWSGILNQRNDEGQTPLHLAIKNNKQKLANKFIKLGANQDILDVYGNSCKQVNSKHINKQSGGGQKQIITGKRIL